MSKKIHFPVWLKLPEWLKLSEEILEKIIKDNLDKFKKIFEEKPKKERSNYYLLKHNYFDDSNKKEFLELLSWIWVLSSLKSKTNPELSNKKYNDNYKDWIRKKILLSSKEAELKTREQLDEEMNIYVNLAVQHINRYLNENIEKKDELKSPYFERIHSQEKTLTLFELLSFYMELEKQKTDFFWKNEDINIDKYSDFLKSIKMWQYEIQRILWLTNLYIDSQKTLTYKNILEEQDFLNKKIYSLSKKDPNDKIPSVNADNPFYNTTKRKVFYWIRTKNNEYKVCDTFEKWTEKMLLDGLILKWKTKPFSKIEKEVEILHIWSRIKKDPYSSVNKYLLKWFSSFDEILDHKWFMFLIKSYEDSKNLIKIIENELSTWDNAWLERPEFIKKIGWNKNTDSDYNSIKWVLKVNYLAKLIKEFFNKLEQIFNKKELKKYEKNISKLKKNIDSNNINNIDIDFMTEIENFVKIVNNEELFSIYKDLKSKFWDKKYNINVEIQIFDIKNYLKAEKDPKSSAYHGRYKWLQVLDILEDLFPKEIYWEDTIDTTKKEALKKYKK